MRLRFDALALLFGLACLPAWAADPLADRVTIYRDEYGVPHIAGDTEEAAFFGYGYAQAEDHLAAMMLQYRDAQGRRAEVAGFDALGDGYLRFIPYEYRWDGDYLQRLLRTRRGVTENRARMDPAVYRILDAFARGVNRYIGEHRAALPSWIDAISAEDIEALERSQYFRFYSIHDALTKLSDPPGRFPNFGSNQWAIAPSKSASGRIIHVEHTHMPWANRFQNYEAHLVAPGLNAGGISWFGSPFFLDGFNGRITWSATWNEPNMADVYEEKLNPENHLEYLYDGKWRPVRVEAEVFRIKGPRGLESLTLPLYYTHHGPVVKMDPEKHRAYAVRLPNFDGVNYSLGLYGLMKARTLDQFKAHVSRQLMPRWNLLYSDAANIYWVYNANVARRADGFDWSKPVPGWTGKTEWGPFIPFTRYPQLLNPASGFLQNCNNPPWVATRNSGLRPRDPVPYFLKNTPRADAGEEALNTRGERLFQVLGENRKFTLDEMTALGFDTYVVPAAAIVPLLEKSTRETRDPRIAAAMERIRSWDRRSSVDSTAYTYLYFWGQAYRELYGGQFGRFLSYARRKIDTDSPGEQKMALAAFERALGRMQALFGKTGVRWGDINVALRGGRFPMDGEPTYGVLHPDEGVEQENGEIHCNDGWGHLLIVMEGQPKQVWSLLPYGQSEDPASPHYNDQAKLHSQRRVKRFWLTAEEILAHAESVRGDRGRIRRVLGAGETP